MSVNFYLCACGKKFTSSVAFGDHMTVATLFNDSTHSLKYQSGDERLSEQSISTFIHNNLGYMMQHMTFIPIVQEPPKTPTPSDTEGIERLLTVLQGGKK